MESVAFHLMDPNYKKKIPIQFAFLFDGTIAKRIVRAMCIGLNKVAHDDAAISPKAACGCFHFIHQRTAENSKNKQ
jgi:hypothetical protein